MKGRFRNRWWVVFASALGLLVGNGPIMQFTFGVLLTPVSREFGWNRGTVSSAIVAGLWTTAVATPVFGWLVDRLGIRVVLRLPPLLLREGALRAQVQLHVSWMATQPVAEAQHALYLLTSTRKHVQVDVSRWTLEQTVLEPLGLADM